MKNNLTPKRTALIERILRQSRTNVFNENERIADKMTEKILRCKALLKPIWDEHHSEMKHKADERFMYSTM